MKNLFDNFNKDFYTVKEINELAINFPEKLIKTSEDIFKIRTKKIIDYIINNKEKCKLILITGPSSSGKTTFSKILRYELRKLEIWNDIISLDNFYNGFKNIPILEDGSRDFESINGLNINGIKNVLSNLLEHGKGDIPLYNFQTMSITDKKIQIEVPKDGIIIVEGLHAINPIITDELKDKNILKLYIDVKDIIKSENGDDFIKSDYIRLMRRIGRDYKYRYTLPFRTIIMWKNVKRGEELYIRPLKKYADFIINTFHNYEPCVMGNDVVSFLDSVPQNLNIDEFKEKLSVFEHLSKDLVPEDSLIREFI